MVGWQEALVTKEIDSDFTFDSYMLCEQTWAINLSNQNLSTVHAGCLAHDVGQNHHSLLPTPENSALG